MVSTMYVWNNLSKNKNLASSVSNNSHLLFARKSSIQSNKISKIILSPTNRTLLKPRKEIKNGITTERLKPLAGIQSIVNINLNLNMSDSESISGNEDDRVKQSHECSSGFDNEQIEDEEIEGVDIPQKEK